MYDDDFIEKMTVDGVIVAYAASFDFPDETLRNWTGTGNIIIDGETFYGLGELGSIGAIEQVSDANPASVELSLVGIPGTVFNAVMQSNIRGSDVTLYKVILTDQGQVLAAAPCLVGQVTEYTWSFNTTGTFSLQVADEFALYERPLQKYYTHSSWQSDNPDDGFWKYVAQLASKQIHWGSESDGSKFTK